MDVIADGRRSHMLINASMLVTVTVVANVAFQFALPSRPIAPSHGLLPGLILGVVVAGMSTGYYLVRDRGRPQSGARRATSISLLVVVSAALMVAVSTNPQIDQALRWSIIVTHTLVTAALLLAYSKKRDTR